MTASGQKGRTSSDGAVVLGRLGRAHGLRGELRFFPEDPSSTILGEIGEVGLGERGLYRVDRARPAGRFWIVSFEGVTDREGAEPLENLELTIDRAQLPESDDRHYLADLVGLEVVDGHDQRLGRITGVEVAGPQAHLIVEAQEETWLLPAVEAFLIEVDAEAGLLRVEIPEGLLEAQRG